MEPSKQQQDGVLSLTEITTRFFGKYVAVEVKGRDADGQPAYGRVIASHFDKYKLKDMMQSQRDVCIFYAGPIPKAGFFAVF